MESYNNKSESGFMPLQNDEHGHDVPIAVNGATSDLFRRDIDGRTVLVKRLKAAFANEERYHQLFRKEYAVGREMKSPYIVRYYGYHEDPVPEIEMEFVVGSTLEDCVKNYPEYFRNRKNFECFILQLLYGLEHMHQHHVLHLDLKPENIMLTRVNNDVKILDLGFCYSSAYQSTPGMNEEFAAPEQRNGGMLDSRTDIYAVGMIMHYVISRCGIKRLSGFMPYFRVMTRCTADRPEDRYRKVGEVVEAINRKHRLWKWIVPTVAVALLLVGIVSFITFPRQIHRCLFGYDFTAWHMRYVILSDDSMTCEVVGADDSDFENNLSIVSQVKYDGECYRVLGVGDSAFYGRKDIRVVTLERGIRYIGDSSFDGTNINVFKIPEGCTKYGIGALQMCPRLRHVIFPSHGLKAIPRTFLHHAGIRTIEIPEGVETIAQDAFVNCAQLSYVKLPSTLKTIDRGIFYKCPQLTSLVIPASVTTIGEYVFMDNPNFRTLYNYAVKPQPVTELFDDPAKVTVYVPKQSVELYKNASYWKMCIIKGM